LFPNDENVLRPGLFGRVTAPTKILSNALVVPQIAVVELQGNYFVSIIGPDDMVKTLKVKPGPTEGPNQVVEGSGLQAGQKIIVEGVEKVRPNMKVNPKPYQPPAAATPTPGASPSPATKS
jgi:membrane fusion protein (multidrug efflux system)